MKQTQLLILALIICNVTLSQTIVSGNITGVWSQEAGPYIVTGNINIVDSLIIEAGVTVQFQAGGWRIEIGSGDRFFAAGNEENPIIFEPYQGIESGSWDQIYFNSSGQDDTISYCIVRYATNGIYALNSNPKINNCEIYGNLEMGIHFRTDAGATYKASVSNCIVRDNGTYGIRILGYNSSGSTNLVMLIDHCQIFNNVHDGILVKSGTLWTGDYAYALADINNCLTYNNSNGVKAYAYRGYADAKLTNTIIALNKGYGAINVDSRSYIGAEDIIYNCFWGNKNGNFSAIKDILNGFGLNGDYQNYNGDSCDINFNIYNDPIFVDTLNANFNLQSGSKCIDAGTNVVLGKFIIDPDGTIPDIGVNYFDQTETEVQKNEVISGNILHQNHPNPFSSTTEITYLIEKAGFVSLKVYDTYGHEIQLLVNKEQQAGEYTTRFTAGGLPGGIYYYQLIVGNDFMETKKMVIMK